MNNQNILRKGQTKLDAMLDNSEFYDFELVDRLLYKIDIALDISELYDFELVVQEWISLDAILDSSEYYDYNLGENVNDYIIVVFITITYRILTENDYFLITEDGFKLRY